MVRVVDLKGRKVHKVKINDDTFDFIADTISNFLYPQLEREFRKYVGNERSKELAEKYAGEENARKLLEIALEMFDIGEMETETEREKNYRSSEAFRKYFA